VIQKTRTKQLALVNFVGEFCSSFVHPLLLGLLSNLQRALVLVQSRKIGRSQWQHPYVKALPVTDPVTVRYCIRSTCCRSRGSQVRAEREGFVDEKRLELAFVRRAAFL